jgi:uncharacterized integral membrane protein
MQSHEEGWKQPHETTVTPKKRTMSPTLLGFVVVVAVALIFILQNRGRTDIHFLFFDHSGRQWVNVVIAMAVGVLLDRLFALWWRRRKRDKSDDR